MRKDYRDWLDTQQYTANTVNTQCSHVARLEQAYGDLDAQFDTDRLDGVAASLRYSMNDARGGLPNPSQIQVSGDTYKSLASFRTALGLYRRFRDEKAGQTGSEGSIISLRAVVPAARSQASDESRVRIGLERDLQQALRREISQLEQGLTIIDEGVERSVPSGYIDITARDISGAVTIIELKAATADRTAIGQILSYMGDVAEEEITPVRGILIAHDFDNKAQAAARMVPNLMLRSYAIKFTFMDALVRSDRSS